MDLHGARVYLAGPMTGYPDHNADAFHKAALVLRSLGAAVYTPHEGPNPASHDEERMDADLDSILASDVVVCLEAPEGAIIPAIPIAEAFSIPVVALATMALAA